jgi:hypothetical protein
MENMDVNPEAKNASGKPSKMKAIFAAVFAVALVFGGVYYFVFGQEQATPPSLGAGDSLYQGLIQDGSLAQFEQSEIDAWVANGEKITQFEFTTKNQGMVSFHLDAPMTMEELVGALNPNTTGEFAFVLWGESTFAPTLDVAGSEELFYITEQSYYSATGGVLKDVTEPELPELTIPAGITIYLITSQNTEMHSNHVFLGDEAVPGAGYYDVCTSATAGWTNYVATTDAIAQLSVCPPNDVFRLKSESELAGLEKGIVYERVNDLSTLSSLEVLWVYYEKDPVIVAKTPVETLPPYICMTTEKEYLQAFAESVGNLKSYDVYGLLAENDRSSVDEMYTAVQYANDGLSLNELTGALEQLSGPVNTVVNDKDLLTLIAVTLEPSIPALIGVTQWYDDYSVNAQPYLSNLTNTIGGVSVSMNDMSESGLEIENYLLEADVLFEYLVNDISNWASVNQGFVDAETNINDTRNVILNELEFDITDLGNDSRHIKVLAKNDVTIGTDAYLQDHIFLELDVTLVTDVEGCYRGDFDYIDDARKDIFVNSVTDFTDANSYKALVVSEYLNNMVPIFEGYVTSGDISYLLDGIHEFYVLVIGLDPNATLAQDAKQILDANGYTVLNFNSESQFLSYNVDLENDIWACTDEVGNIETVLRSDEVGEQLLSYIDVYDKDGDLVTMDIGYNDLLSQYDKLIKDNEYNIVVRSYLVNNLAAADVSYWDNCSLVFGESDGAESLTCEQGYSLNEIGSACVEDAVVCDTNFFAVEEGCELNQIDENDFTVSYNAQAGAASTATLTWTLPGVSYAADVRFSTQAISAGEEEVWWTNNTTQPVSNISNVAGNDYSATVDSLGPNGSQNFFALKLSYNGFESQMTIPTDITPEESNQTESTLISTKIDSINGYITLMNNRIDDVTGFSNSASLTEEEAAVAETYVILGTEALATAQDAASDYLTYMATGGLDSAQAAEAIAVIAETAASTAHSDLNTYIDNALYGDTQ